MCGRRQRETWLVVAAILSAEESRVLVLAEHSGRDGRMTHGWQHVLMNSNLGEKHGDLSLVRRLAGTVRLEKKSKAKSVAGENVSTC
jgi:hypothetical protein